MVDDHRFVQKVLESLLTSMRFQAMAVGSGEEALEILMTTRSDPFSLVLMDWKMPGMSGLDATAQIAKGACWRRPPRW